MTAGEEFAYEWSLLELYDQTVRHTRGGEMAWAIAHANAAQRRYIHSRIGMEAPELSDLDRALRLLRSSPRAFLTKLRRRGPHLRTAATDLTVRAIGGKAALRQLRLGRFRTSGEIHLWMYDRFSLCRLLTTAGFSNVAVMSPGESRIQEFASFGLELDHEAVMKPDSLYVEGVRP